MGSPGFVPTPTLKSRLALNKLHSTLSLGLLICKIGSSRVYVKMLSEMRQCRQDGASDPQDDPQQNIWCIQDGASDPQRPVLLPSWGDRGAEPREQRVTASCPAPHPLSAAAGPTGHTGSPLDGSPSATAARRPEHAGLAQGLPGRLPAPISGRPCTCLSCAPALLHLSVSPRPPSPCALINSYPPSNPGWGAASRLAPCSPAHPVPCCKPAPPAGSALLPWGAGPVPSHSRTLSICVSPLQSGLLIKILQVSVFAGAEGACTQVLQPPPTWGSSSAAEQAGPGSLAGSPLSSPHPAPTNSGPISGWPVSIPLKPWAWGGGSLIRDLDLEYIYF